MCLPSMPSRSSRSRRRLIRRSLARAPARRSCSLPKTERTSSMDRPMNFFATATSTPRITSTIPAFQFQSCAKTSSALPLEARSSKTSSSTSGTTRRLMSGSAKPFSEPCPRCSKCRATSPRSARIFSTPLPRRRVHRAPMGFRDPNFPATSSLLRSSVRSANPICKACSRSQQLQVSSTTMRRAT